MKIISVVGARPNFMKIAPFMRAIEYFNNNSNKKIEHILVHTGQHYDNRMSKTFFEELNIRQADINLGIGSGTHAEQVGKTMIAFEKVLLNENPDWVIVVGDVNATLACSVTAKKLKIKVCHIEAGLRSGDMQMPEEINRIVTDHLSDLLLTPDRISYQNLLKEGISENKIKFVGNIMIDTLKENIEKAKDLDINDIITKNTIYDRKYRIFPDNFALLTLHRPSNVDYKETLKELVNYFNNELSKKITLIWSIHPRTKKRLKEFQLWDSIEKNDKIILLEPLKYRELLSLNMNARLLLTDSGGLQEEATILGTPCITLRNNTERPITLEKFGGVSILVGNNINKIKEGVSSLIKRKRLPIEPELWDGKTAGRCLNEIVLYMG